MCVAAQANPNEKKIKAGIKVSDLAGASHHRQRRALAPIRITARETIVSHSLFVVGGSVGAEAVELTGLAKRMMAEEELKEKEALATMKGLSEVREGAREI